MAKILSFLRDESGATAIEYGLILSLIVIAIVGALQGLEGAMTTMYEDIDSEMGNAIVLG